MGCLYCGASIPPRRWKFCSDDCAHKYSRLVWARKRTGNDTTEHCVNCGKILKYKQKKFCSEFCEMRYH